MFQHTGFKRSYRSSLTMPLSVISSIKEIMVRIKGAKPDSPIAVFTNQKTLPGKEIGLVAVFGSTFETKQIAVKSNKRFVGMFCRSNNLKEVESALIKALAA